jgi:probable rRNA maturation factor
MADHASQVELSIDLGNDKSNTALLHLLSSLPLEAVVNQTLQMAAITQPVMLTLLITSDEAIHNLNKQYRGLDKPTDVLSFLLLDKPIVDAPADQLWMPSEAPAGETAQTGSTKQVFITPPELTTNLGDVVISWPAVVRQAAGAGHDPTYELLYLLSHGVLHLIGYDDQTEAGYQAMVRIQQAVMEATEQRA